MFHSSDCLEESTKTVETDNVATSKQNVLQEISNYENKQKMLSALYETQNRQLFRGFMEIGYAMRSKFIKEKRNDPTISTANSPAIPSNKPVDERKQPNVECVICLDRVPDILFLDCRHLCLCTDCYKNYQKTQCPVCRIVNSKCIQVLIT